MGCAVWRLGLMMVVLALLAAGCGTGTVTPTEPTVDLDTRFSQEELVEDLAYLWDGLESVHPDLYAFRDQADAEHTYNEVKAALEDNMQRLDFYRLVAPLVASLGDGHTGLRLPDQEWRKFLEGGGQVFPLRLDIDRQTGAIVDCIGDCGHGLAGSAVQSINGHSFAEVYETLLKYVSGERTAFRETVLGRRFSQLLWTVYGWEGPFVVEAAIKDGEGTLTATIPGADIQDIRAFQPETPEPYVYRILEAHDAAVLEFRSFVDRDQFQSFLAAMFEDLEQQAVEHLIIDIRDNGGGHSALGDDLLAYIATEPFRQFEQVDVKVSERIRERYPRWAQLQRTETGEILSMPGDYTDPRSEDERFSGETYLLTSSFTFSSAASFAAAFKHHDMGTVIGEETGGLRITFGDLYRFYLPHTGLPAAVSHKRFVSPGRGQGGIVPHRYAPRSDAQKGDPALEKALEMIEQGRDDS